ncbi:hypothetical protein KAR48_20700 [bacterium]|nr:hypothetical protein [bacterium]
MKRLIMFVVVTLGVLYSSPLSAQSCIQKGAYSIGGGFQYYAESRENVDGNTYYFNASPGLEHFIVNKFAVGFMANYLSISYKNGRTTQWYLGPVMRYYFFENDNVMTFAGAGYLKGSNKYRAAFFMLGADKLITKNIALESVVKYTDLNNWVKAQRLSVEIGVKVFLFN